MNKKGWFVSWSCILSISLVFTSCSGMLFTSIDILRPAKVIFPPEVTSVVLINNSVVQDPGYGHTTQFFNENDKSVSIPTDSLSVYCLAALAEGMAEKEFFSRVTLEPNSINKKQYYYVPTPPNRDTVEAIARRNKADGVISLNRILVNDKLGDFYNPDHYGYVAYLEAYYETQWSIHFPEKKRIYTFTSIDTVFWESVEYSRQKALDGLPDRTNALIDGALIAGEKSVNRFIPWWDKVDRYLFDSRSDKIKPGLEAFYRKEWEEAEKEWAKSLAEGKNNSTNGKLAHNLAVVSEIRGNIEKAKEYSDTSLQYFLESVMIRYDQFVLVVQYNEELANRLTEVSKISLQLGETPSTTPIN